MAGIPTSNILQPGAISLSGGANRQLVSDLQLLTPQFYNKYSEKYGDEDFTHWLATFGGMKEVKNRDYFWFENRGKLMVAVTSLNAVVAPAAGATVTCTLSSVDHYNAGTQTPLRVGETVRVASSNIEGVILTIPDTTANAFQFTVRPKKSTQAFVSAGSANLLAGEILVFGGNTDVGEASDSVSSLIHLDQKYTNTITEIRDSFSATDLAEMTEVYYNSGVSGEAPGGAGLSGPSLFTLKGLWKTNQRFKNNIEAKLMFGDVQNNTGLNTTTSVGSQGIIPKIVQDGETVTYTPGTLDIAKLHEITRVMDVNGCEKENVWLMDVYQRQNFSDGIFAAFPAGAWVWGQNEKSQEAAIAYGVQSCLIDGYLFKAKKYGAFNTEVRTGKTPTTDYFRNFGVITPQGTTRDAKTGDSYNNVDIMYQAPPKGGTIGNGIRVWRHGGGSENPTNGKMEDKVEMLTYRGSRVTKANQFIIVQSA
jgi:hypothetical protein